MNQGELPDKPGDKRAQDRAYRSADINEEFISCFMSSVDIIETDLDDASQSVAFMKEILLQHDMHHTKASHGRRGLMLQSVVI